MSLQMANAPMSCKPGRDYWCFDRPHARPYDLLVFSQTVPDAPVEKIMASAVKLHPDVRFLIISEGGRQRQFGCATFTAEVFKPDRLRQKVAGLLDGNGREAEPS